MDSLINKMDALSIVNQSLYTVYLYDLPKLEYTSQKMAHIVKQKTGLIIDKPPTILQDFNKKFMSAFMQIHCENIE